MNYEWPNEEIYANMKRRKLTNKNEEPSTATEAVLLDPENRARRREQMDIWFQERLAILENQIRVQWQAPVVRFDDQVGLAHGVEWELLKELIKRYRLLEAYIKLRNTQESEKK